MGESLKSLPETQAALSLELLGQKHKSFSEQFLCTMHLCTL